MDSRTVTAHQLANASTRERAVDAQCTVAAPSTLHLAVPTTMEALRHRSATVRDWAALRTQQDCSRAVSTSRQRWAVGPRLPKFGG
jgi:hypothetical protein